MCVYVCVCVCVCVLLLSDDCVYLLKLQALDFLC